MTSMQPVYLIARKGRGVNSIHAGLPVAQDAIDCH